MRLNARIFATLSAVVVLSAFLVGYWLLVTRPGNGQSIIERINAAILSLKRRELKSQTHYSCTGPWMESYKTFHAQSLAKNSSRGNDVKYLVYFCDGPQNGCGGFGNRLFGIVSLFYLAVLTKRVFMIHWGGPDDLEIYLQPNEIQWSYQPGKINGLDVKITYWGSADVPRVPAGMHDFRAEIEQSFQNWVGKVNLIELLTKDVEAIGTIWNFAERIWTNPHLRQRALELGLPPDKPDFPFAMTGCAASFLFKNSPAFNQHLIKARSVLTRRSRPYIGIHIRTSDHHFGLPDADYSYRTRNVDKVFDCAQRVEKALKAKYNIQRRNMTWFLAADDANVKRRALQKFPQKVVAVDVSPAHLEYNHYEVISVLRDLLTDIFLLGECNYFVGTWYSTFSYTVQGFSHFTSRSFVYGEACELNEKQVELIGPALDTIHEDFV